MTIQYSGWTTGLQTYPYIDENYFIGGHHGCQAEQGPGEAFTTVANEEETKVKFSFTNWDTDAFFTTIPECIIIPAPGMYIVTAQVGWLPPINIDEGWRDVYVDEYGVPHYYFVNDRPVALEVIVKSTTAGLMAYGNQPPLRQPKDNLYMSVHGQAPLAQGEEVGLFVRHNNGNPMGLVQELYVCPKLTIEWIGNHVQPTNPLSTINT